GRVDVDDDGALGERLLAWAAAARLARGGPGERKDERRAREDGQHRGRSSMAHGPALYTAPPAGRSRWTFRRRNDFALSARRGRGSAPRWSDRRTDRRPPRAVAGS